MTLTLAQVTSQFNFKVVMGPPPKSSSSSSAIKWAGVKGLSQFQEI